MNELVITNAQGREVTTSIIVAEVFERNHADVLRDVRNLHCSADFRLRNFAEMFEIKQLPNNGTRKDPYYEMTKDGFSFLVMGYTGEKAGEFKERFISEFNKREAMLRNDDYILQRSQEILTNRMRALEMAMQQKDERLSLQAKELKEAAPKVVYYENVLQSKSLILTNVIAKDLGMSAVSLNRLLHQLGIIYKSGETWVLYHKYQDKGYTHTKTHTYTDSKGNECTSVQMYWTESGREFVIKTVKEYLKSIENGKLNVVAANG